MKILSIYVLHDTKKIYHIMRWQVFSSFGFVCFLVWCFRLFCFKQKKKEKTYCLQLSSQLQMCMQVSESHFSKSVISVFKTCFFKGMTCGTSENVTQLTFKGQKK